jgi:alkylated DNA repair dioxygenase AlkB
MQGTLFGSSAPAFDASFSSVTRRLLSKDAWLEHAPQWLVGHQTVFDELRAVAAWQHQRRQMYDREVEVPRLVAPLPERGHAQALLREAAGVLSRRYGVGLASISLAYYRDGHDSVAPHGDKLGSLRHNTVVAILSLGSPRRFTLRAVDGSLKLSFALGWGDLLVMGGSCQDTFLHGVPKVRHAEPRMSIQFREQVPIVVAKAYRDDITYSEPVRLAR